MKTPIRGIAVFQDKKIKGTVIFTEDLKKNDVIIEITLSGLKKNALLGFHVHEAGDLSDGCASACAHFNPYGKKHGGIDSKERHVGDLGNLVTNNLGEAKYSIRDNIIKLRGSKANIIGRGLVIHEGEDDCGLGGHEDSLTTGHSGGRSACAVIGYRKVGNAA